MPNNCLILSLQSGVSDPTLRKLGEFKMKIDKDVTYGRYDIAVQAGQRRGIARIIGDASVYFTDSTHAQNWGHERQESGSNYTVNGSGGDLFIGGKDVITNLSLTTGVILDLKELKYCPNLIWIYGQSGTLEGDIGNLSEIANQMVRLDFRATNNVYGDLAVFANCTTLTNLTLERTNCTGSMLNLSKCHGLATLYLYDTAGVTGNPDDLADAMYDGGAGRTSGTMAYTSSDNSHITYTFSAGGWSKA